jgi:acyl carrier protein
MSGSLRVEILALLSQAAGRAVTGDDATPIFQGGLALDSIALLEIVVGLEERFGLRLRPEDGAQAFATIGTLTAFVAARRAPDRRS